MSHFNLLQGKCQLTAQFGTTPNIKHIVVGRCYNYITLVNPSLRYDCEEIWRQFEEAVVRQSSCNVTVEDYHQMFYAMPQTCYCIFPLSSAYYAAVVRHFWTLEDTLVGFMFNDLIWCGQEEDSGFDFSSCPEWSACRNHPVYSLWRRASQNVSLNCRIVTTHHTVYNLYATYCSKTSSRILLQRDFPHSCVSLQKWHVATSLYY
uniref:ADP-ribosyl cyclase/cyclic ADP-ribose hydrolase n=1 Tax=Lates calcarifer TaxID=8187 RepID=A0A4W6DXS9_LATCA